MDNQSQPEAQQPTQQTTPPSNGYYKKGSWKKWVLIYGVVAVLLYGGIYYFVLSKNKSNPYSYNTSPSPTQSVQKPSPTTDPTANWKTYTNTKYGYTFKYPNPWTENCSKDISQNSPLSQSVIVCPEAYPTGPFGGIPAYFNVTVESKKIGETAQDIKKLKEKENPSIKEVSVPKIANYDVAASYFEGAGIPNATVYLVKNPSDTTYMNITGDGIDENIYNQILSTFKFTDVSPTKENQKTVGLGEYCGGRNQTKCSAGLICKFTEGSAEDAPGTCIKQ